MDKNRIRKLAGLEVLTESVTSWRNPGKGPNLNLSMSDFDNPGVIIVSLSSGKIIGPLDPNSPADRKGQDKVLNRKLKDIVRAVERFETDVERILKK